MRSLKSWLPVVVLFLVSLVPVVAVGQLQRSLGQGYSRNTNTNTNANRHGNFDGESMKLSFKIDGIYYLAGAIAIAGIAIGMGINSGLKARGVTGKAG
jgi:hypothetical protein